MSLLGKTILGMFMLIPLIKTDNSTKSSETINLTKLSEDFLIELKEGGDVSHYIDLLKVTEEKTLIDQLDTDDKKISFWVNVYNGFILVHLRDNPEYYDGRRSFFKAPLMVIAGQEMSFSDIEHGILRRSKFELLLGYVGNPFVKRYKRKFRPKKMDYRIHFALNCGAKSCPPVDIYHHKTLRVQFDASAKRFLNEFSSFDAKNRQVNTTALFSWFRGDFSGKKGTKRILKQYGIIPDVDVDLVFDTYDWTLYLDNFVE